MAANTQSAGCSLPIPLVVFFVFFGLQLSHAIHWSWWWVTAPLWVGAGFTLVFFTMFLGFATRLAWVARK